MSSIKVKTLAMKLCAKIISVNNSKYPDCISNVEDLFALLVIWVLRENGVHNYGSNVEELNFSEYITSSPVIKIKSTYGVAIEDLVTVLVRKLDEARLSDYDCDCCGQRQCDCDIKYNYVYDLMLELLNYSTAPILDLSNINIGVFGAEVLAQLLRYDTTIKVLNLNNSNICDSGNYPHGIYALVTTLESNKTLINVNLRSNGFYDDDVLKELISALLFNTTIISLNLSNTDNRCYVGGERYTGESEAYSKILCYIKRNIILYNRVTWTPHLHLNFGNKLYFTEKVLPIHSMILTCLLANTEYQVVLPKRVWCYIFSFIQQGNVLMD